MKTISYILLSFCFIAISEPGSLIAQSEAPTSQKAPPLSFPDKNKDGINDEFRDADGDGINDVTGKRYQHRFEFVDKNKDGRNDLWLDSDGDGVNDLHSKLSKKARSKRTNWVLDFDGDGKNDITGSVYQGREFEGKRFGFIDESTGKIQGKFMDENGNGIDDRLERTDARRQRSRDMFIDEDGDGICDGRSDSLRRHSRGGQRHGHKK